MATRAACLSQNVDSNCYITHNVVGYVEISMLQFLTHKKESVLWRL